MQGPPPTTKVTQHSGQPHEVAGNLAHEWTHKLGFGHESAAEHDSVPYGIGYIVREMGEKLSK
jgi:hypothetical protein